MQDIIFPSTSGRTYRIGLWKRKRFSRGGRFKPLARDGYVEMPLGVVTVECFDNVFRVGSFAVESRPQQVKCAATRSSFVGERAQANSGEAGSVLIFLPVTLPARVVVSSLWILSLIPIDAVVLLLPFSPRAVPSAITELR